MPYATKRGFPVDKEIILFKSRCFGNRIENSLSPIDFQAFQFGRRLWLSTTRADLVSSAFFQPYLSEHHWLLAISDQLTTLFNSRQLTNFDWFFFDTRMSWSISFLKKCIKSYYANFGAKRSFLETRFDHPFEKETDAKAADFPILKSSCQHQKNKVHAAPCKTFVCLLILTTTTTGGKYVKVKCLTMPLTVPNSPYNYFCQQSLYPSQKNTS